MRRERERLIRCQHNFICGTQGYFCKKCGCNTSYEMPTFSSSSSLFSSSSTESVGTIADNAAAAKKDKRAYRKREFLRDVLAGLGVSLGVGFAIIIGLML